MDANMQIVLPLIILQVILLVLAMFDLIRRDASRVRGGKKWPWALVIVFISTLGPVTYFFAGRKD
ncbi:PLD nuclease N-terminal domain-containing protein [Brevibacillus dissolubilis]|uniref:PLD nuclease N-terminal domain-containing protein n=1 Tax=Brevibacillus dissolubilis TaxID=1844116 RepID=UPI001115CC00|nr:PLD nuclease N-terminal domain-containing protein [Brevibacillus dissolubilis]